MAQMGSFVPADEAVIGITDRIFARIGAQDEIHAGQSTFMVEMIETARLLSGSSNRSLLIIDEVGRGTSTYDGLAIARAVIEYIHDEKRLNCRTLFATHFHELTELPLTLPRAENFNISVMEIGEQVIFTHQVSPGGANRSYGVHVAQLAGVPHSVVKRAHNLLNDMENNSKQTNFKPEHSARVSDEVTESSICFEDNTESESIEKKTEEVSSTQIESSISEPNQLSLFTSKEK